MYFLSYPRYGVRSGKGLKFLVFNERYQAIDYKNSHSSFEKCEILTFNQFLSKLIYKK